VDVVVVVAVAVVVAVVVVESVDVVVVVAVAVVVAVVVVESVDVVVVVAVAVVVVESVDVVVVVSVAVVVAVVVVESVDVVVVVAVVVVVVVSVAVVVVVLVIVVVVVVGCTAGQASPALTLLVSKVTAPFLAYSPPLELAPVTKVIDVSASTLPTKVVVVPMVAELPTCQKTLQGEAPPIRITEEAVAVVSVEPIWKTQTLLESPWPSRTRAPVSCALVEKE
jgi:hypothetical protein